MNAHYWQGSRHGALNLLWLIIVAMCLQGCNNENEDELSSNKFTIAISPTAAIDAGQDLAATSFLAKKWQLQSIDDMPLPHMVVMDFTNIKDGHATMHSPCQSIQVLFDTAQLPHKLNVVDIERDLMRCSDSFEDRLMAHLADLISFEKQGGMLVLHAYQGDLVLTAVDDDILSTQ